jgi:hypothetical protein
MIAGHALDIEAFELRVGHLATPEIIYSVLAILTDYSVLIASADVSLRIVASESAKA